MQAENMQTAVGGQEAGEAQEPAVPAGPHADSFPGGKKGSACREVPVHSRARAVVVIPGPISAALQGSAWPRLRRAFAPHRPWTPFPLRAA